MKTVKNLNNRNITPPPPQLKSHQNSSTFSFFLNIVRDGARWGSRGRKFHRREAATEKALCLLLTSLVLLIIGTVNRASLAERSAQEG